MGIALGRRAAHPAAVNAPGFISRLLGHADRLRHQLNRPPWRWATGAPRAARPSADEIDYRNELIARLGKAD